jgi:3-phenylpropionate/cinnamic acid dioxygenase small subunit
MSAAPVTATEAVDLQKVHRLLEEFVHREMDLLDRREFEQWADLFVDEGYYWAPVGQDQASPKTAVSLFYDDVRTMRTRIMRLRHPRIYVQNPPSRTVHLVSNFRDFDGNAERMSFRCNFAMFEFRVTKGQAIYGGVYEYDLRRVDDQWRIASKKALLANSEDMFPSLAVWF